MRDKFTISTFISGLLACLIGLVYLLVSGAPQTMIIVNAAAMLIAILLAISMTLSVRITDNFVSVVTVMGALMLLGTSTFGYAIEDARRWVLMGPFFVQTSFILLPAIALGFARIQNFWTTLAVIMAGLAMAIQPDRAMAAMLFAAVTLICWMRPNKLTFSASIFCAFGFLITLILPDRLPAVPFVDHILWTAFDVSIITGLSLWLGCLAMVCPILFIAKNKRIVIHYTFATCWLALIAAAAIGAYPTPIIGYGASAIIGYFLSLIFVQPVKQSHSIAGTVTTDISDTESGSLQIRNNSPYFAV